MIRIGINGFGRIGRAVFRLAHASDDVEVAAINDLLPVEACAHLLKYDSVMGPFPGSVETSGNNLVVDGREVPQLTVRDPGELPWRDLGVQVAIESTGVFRARAEVAKHLEAGASRVVLTVPAKDELDATVVLGVNDEVLKPEHQVVSNASCTTNCLAPMAKVLHDSFGVLKGVMNTIHAYTNDQTVVDGPHKDLRRARAAAVNIIPTSTGAAKAVGQVLPDLNGKLHGFALRVPVPNGSVVDLSVQLGRSVTAEEVNEAFRAAAEGSMRGVLEYSRDPIVSSDIVGRPASCIVDSPLTMVMGDDLVKVVGWYDNEWGYSSRVVDLVRRVAAL